MAVSSASASLVLAACLTEEQDAAVVPSLSPSKNESTGYQRRGIGNGPAVLPGRPPRVDPQTVGLLFLLQARASVCMKKEFPSVASKGCSREADKSTVGSSPRPPAELIDRISFTLADCDDVGPINPSGWSLALISVPSGCALAGREPATRNAVCGHGQSDKPMAKLKSLVAPSNSPYSARHCREHLRPAG